MQTTFECSSYHRQLGSGSPVDVRVRGTVGQQPLEATTTWLHKPICKANFSDHLLYFQGPQGIMHESCVFCRSHFLDDENPLGQCSGKSGKQRTRPLPPLVLSGAAASLLLAMLLLKPLPNPTIKWQVTRIIKGVYRRRPAGHELVSAPTMVSPPRKSHAAGNGQTARRLLAVLMLAVLLHHAAASPVRPTGPTHLQTPNSLGATNLCSRKLSFRKAQRAALDRGTAVYRGRLMTAKQLGVEWCAARPVKQPSVRRANSSHPTIRVVTWNSGGLILSDKLKSGRNQKPSPFTSCAFRRLVGPPLVSTGMALGPVSTLDRELERAVCWSC